MSSQQRVTLLPLRQLLFVSVASEENRQFGCLRGGCLGDVFSWGLMDVGIQFVVLYVVYGISTHPSIGCQE